MDNCDVCLRDGVNCDMIAICTTVGRYCQQCHIKLQINRKTDISIDDCGIFDMCKECGLGKTDARCVNGSNYVFTRYKVLNLRMVCGHCQEKPHNPMYTLVPL